VANEGLGQMIAVALGGIDQVHAQLTRPAHQPVDLVLR